MVDIFNRCNDFEKVLCIAILLLTVVLTCLLCTVFNPLTLAGVALVSVITCIGVLYIIEY